VIFLYYHAALRKHNNRRKTMKLLLVIIVAAALALAVAGPPARAQEEKPAKPPVSLTAAEKAAVEKFLKIKLDEARQAVESRNFDYALQVIDAILLLAPQTPLKRKLQELRLSANEKKLQQEVVRVYLHCAKRIHSTGDKIEIRLRIKNISNGELKFPLGSEEARNFGTLTKTTHDYKLSGSTHMRQTQLTIKQNSSITLKKDQVWEKTFEIDTSRLTDKEPAMHRYVLRARLRPLEIISGKEVFSRYLSTGELELYIMPSKYLEMAKNAMKHIKLSVSCIEQKAARGDLAFDARIVLFYSTFFLSEREKKQALPLLFGALEKSSGDTARVIMGSLSFLTGEEHGTSKNDWLDWWKKQAGK
jgi:hypothetical protein